ncbi:MAG: large repetitive protein [Bacillota bacterium]|nr:large repetitive protein [Bacillota bacterium]
MIAARSVRCIRILAAAGAFAVLAFLASGWSAAPVLAVGGAEMPAYTKAGGGMAAGVAYMERGMFEEAVAALSRVVAADPNGPEAAKAFDLLGYLYWCRNWREEALKAFRESLQRAGDAGGRLRARVAVGQVLLDAGRSDEACRELEEALKVAGPEDLDIVYTLLGIAKFEAKDSTGAAEMFSRALEAFPENLVAAAYLQKLSFGMPIHLASVREALAGGGGAAGAAGASRAGAGASDGLLPTHGVIFVNSGATYVTTPQVMLTLGVDQPVPVKGFFLAAGDEAFRWHDWRSPVIEWSLRGEGDGKKPVKVVYYVAVAPGPGTQDGQAGRGMRCVYSAEASVVLDREPPWGSVEINDGARFTNHTRVTLNLRANDRTSGILNVSMSNDGITWSKWTMYQFTKDWEIPSGDGMKKVYVRFQDRAGNVSTPVSARIMLDTVPPDLLWVDVARLDATTADIVWATDEDSDSAVEYVAKKDTDGKSMIVRDKDMTMLHHIRLKDLKPSTTYRFKVFSQDEAGNIAASRVLEFTTKAASHD